MKITDIMSLLGGLALFLYGMQMMSSGLEAAAGNRMKRILERLTSNRFLGVAVGAGITAVIQSSSATTVMVVGFVNSGMMTLRQAVWIIMGANIGTTITGQLIALDIGALAPIIAFLGVAMVVFMKKPSFHHYGQIIAGLGVLFIGMEMMSSAMMPLRESQGFIDLMTNFSNPLLGILAGTLFTAVIQSSSASVGILQALATSGLIGLPSAVYVLFGQNIGTCITAVLASIGTNRNAKRTTIIHLLFNVIGTALFTVICMVTPLVSWMELLTPSNSAAQIANMHTLFNIVTTALLLPLGGVLASIAVRILPEKASETQGTHQLQYIKSFDASREYQIGTSAIAIHGIWRELGRMAEMARENVYQSFSAVLERSSARLEKVEETEEYLDYLNKEISKYISHVIVYEENETDSAVISACFKITGNLERIGDHAINICEYTKRFEEKGMSLSEQATAEIAEMRRVSMEAMDLLTPLDDLHSTRIMELAAYEQKIDDMTALYRQNQIKRMQDGGCEDETCVLYAEMLTDFERIGDHLLNIGQALMSFPEHAIYMGDEKKTMLISAK